jgi:hypothetical protein
MRGAIRRKIDQIGERDSDPYAEEEKAVGEEIVTLPHLVIREIHIDDQPQTRDEKERTYENEGLLLFEKMHHRPCRPGQHKKPCPAPAGHGPLFLEIAPEHAELERPWGLSHKRGHGLILLPQEAVLEGVPVFGIGLVYGRIERRPDGQE